MKALGYTWRRENEHSPWRTLVDHRFHVCTWKFGSIHQAKVLVEYPHATGHHNTGAGYPVPSVGIGLEPGKTKKEAMQRGLDWVAEYQTKGAPDPEEAMAWCFKHYPSLHKTRADVLRNFFTSGTGYEWLDGAIYHTDQEPPMSFAHLEENARKMEEIHQQVWDLLPPEARAKNPDLEPQPVEPLPTERPLPDDGKPINWQISPEYAPLCNIPPDVRSDWLKVALETARLVRDRHTSPGCREMGERILKEFGGR